MLKPFQEVVRVTRKLLSIIFRNYNNHTWTWTNCNIDFGDKYVSKQVIYNNVFLKANMFFLTTRLVLWSVFIAIYLKIIPEATNLRKLLPRKHHARDVFTKLYLNKS